MNIHQELIRLLVIDDHPVVASGLRYSGHGTRAGMEIINTTLSVEEAIEQVSVEDIDLIVLDLFIPDKSPTDNIRLLKKKYGEKPIVIYTTEESPFWMSIMYNEGAIGYIFKSEQNETVRELIKKAYSGQLTYPEKFLTSLSEESSRPQTKRDEIIKPSQRFLLFLLVSGCSGKEIAKKTGLNIFSVAYKLRAMRRLFKVKNNAQLAAKVTELKIV